MIVTSLDYTVKANISFSFDEVTFLVEKAKDHYDPTCRAATARAGKNSPVNGILAQLQMFPASPLHSVCTWSFRELDLVAKILEQTPYLHSEKVIHATLQKSVREAMQTINIRYDELIREKTK